MSFRYALLALFMLASPAGAQFFADENGRVLAGVVAFDAAVSVTLPDAQPGVRVPANFEENLEDAFVLALRRDGVRVEAEAPNYLTCRVQFLPSIIGGQHLGWAYPEFDTDGYMDFGNWCHTSNLQGCPKNTHVTRIFGGVSPPGE